MLIGKPVPEFPSRLRQELTNLSVLGAARRAVEAEHPGWQVAPQTLEDVEWINPEMATNLREGALEYPDKLKLIERSGFTWVVYRT